MKRNWEILLIGGNSGTGKTTLGRQLSLHYQIPLVELDDIRLAMQEVADPEKEKDLFLFVNGDQEFFAQPKEALADALVKVGEAVWKGLRVVIENHSISNRHPVIIEGDGIIPSKLKDLDKNRVRAVFLYDEQEVLKQRELKRLEEGHARGAKINGRPENPDEFELWLEGYTKVSYLFGQKIRKQAEEEGFVTMCSSPIETLFDRVLKTAE